MSEAGREPWSWRDRRVLVTGATGLLGGHLVEALVRAGAAVTCLVRDWEPRSRTVEEGWIEGATLARGELEDLLLLERVLNEHAIDTVFHLGAQTIVGTASRSPVSTFESNVRGTWNILDACRRLPGLVERIVVASSDKAYGDHGGAPYTEATPLEGRFPYDASKAAADRIAASYFHTYGLPVAIARCANLYGPGDLAWSRLVPGTIRSALRDEPPVIRSDGTPVREWLHVLDAVAAYLRLGELASRPGVAGEAFNFGSGEPRSVGELVALVLRLAGRGNLAPIVLGEARQEIPRQVLDDTKAREQLGWRPARDLEDGLRGTIAWYAERLGARPGT